MQQEREKENEKTGTEETVALCLLQKTRWQRVQFKSVLSPISIKYIIHVSICALLRSFHSTFVHSFSIMLQSTTDIRMLYKCIGTVESLYFMEYDGDNLLFDYSFMQYFPFMICFLFPLCTCADFFSLHI